MCCRRGPTIVSFTIMESMIASSVASIVAANSGSISHHCDSVSNDRGIDAGVTNASSIGGREGKEDVAGAVMADGAGTRHAERHAPGEPLQLMRLERRIGGDDDDDRAHRLAAQFAAGEMLADRNAEDRAFRPSSEIRLHEHADRITAAGRLDDARRRAVAALEVVADHARAAADAALLDRPADRAPSSA